MVREERTNASFAITSSTTLLHASHPPFPPTIVTLTLVLPGGSNSTLLLLPAPKQGLATLVVASIVSQIVDSLLNDQAKATRL